MMTFDQAEKQGYTFTDQDDGSVEVALNDAHVATVHSDCPRFFALRCVAAELEDALATVAVTAGLVTATSGETYVEPAPEPPPPPELANAISDALQSVPDNGTVADLKTAILEAVAVATGN